MSAIVIEYRIKLAPDRVESFSYRLDEETYDLLAEKASTTPPDWSRLEFKQCEHCPLDGNKQEYCPAAVQLADIVQRFHDTRSIDEVDIAVITAERNVIQHLPLQNAIASMLNLVLPICGCPKTAYLKPLARFHLPLASDEEMLFQVIGMYLMSQYFRNLQTGDLYFDFYGLKQIYEDLHKVNKSLASRLQTVTTSDSVKNAITLLDMYSLMVPTLLDEELAEMKQPFMAYLSTKQARVSMHGIEPIYTNTDPMGLEPEDFGSLDTLRLDASPSEDELSNWLKPGGFSKKRHHAQADERKPSTQGKRLPPLDEGMPQSSQFLKNLDFELELEPIAADKLKKKR